MRRIHADERGHRYALVARIIRESVATGELRPGDKLPSLEDMAEHFGVASMTVRRSIQTLLDQEFVVVRPGVGTFIVAEPDTAGDGNLRSQVAKMQAQVAQMEKAFLSRLGELRTNLAQLDSQLAEQAIA